MNGKCYSILLLLLVLQSFSFSQDKAALERQRQQLTQQIAKTNRLLANSTRTEKSKLADLELLTTKSNQLAQLVQSIQKEVKAIDFDIQRAENEILVNQTELNQLRSSYSKNLVIAYKQRKSTNKWLFLLSAKSLNDAFRKVAYLKKWNSYQKQQANTIQQKVTILKKNKNQLTADKKVKNTLLLEQKQQIYELNKNKTVVEKTLQSIRDDKAGIQAQLKQQRAEQQRLQQQISRIIAAEMEAERKRLLAEKKKTNELKEENKETAKKPSAPKTNTPKTYKPAPVNKVLSAKFEQNKGKLPWPVTKGVITSSLGQYGDSVLPGIKKDRDGIDIRTETSSAANAIFAGEVRNVTTMPGFNKVVIISHGSYFSVYCKLSSVSVSAGDKVTTGQQIGVVETKNSISELHLQLWKGQQRLNPKEWLVK